MKKSIIMLLIGVLLSGFAMSQDIPDPRIIQAQQLEAEKKFKEAFKLYEKIHKTAPENNTITFKLAGMAHTSKNYKKSNQIL
ncbi:MAG: hypothetical protein HN995_05430 [Candidatus Marinimicrobia bacterium]|nr:hypothetical protein [Candidatus Neomarinimicrobiota bacterium]MBT3575663.1 hypothetical protein [Candidatus Neomarinimicrobiota bacterium]MBT3679854.1 hypothetical protein [Candidatus Neomarinimicrobiota bacterium]MBT3952060.1 hypothetical protein [Candidatus Neomarinimicrobiota bacterium]MBT4251951.1 hypothetical protein [Candidatus Neomarinimicrobiota bacterium]